MKWIIVLALMAGVVDFAFVTKKKEPKKQEIVQIIGSYAPVAVLELFTSEGCSSCPPADRLLPELTTLDSNIISLAFHVDYWNRLGWKDPFSDMSFSQRQREYGSRFHLESIYTPQLIVNGEFEVLGSDRAGATTVIKKALEEKATIEIRIEEIKKDGDNILLTCETKGSSQNSDLLAALVQKQAVIDVRAGENNGAKLSHTNIVRSFARQSAKGKSRFSLKIPDQLAEDNWQIVVYAQQKTGRKITGAILYTPTALNNH